MSGFSAIVPVADMAAANAALEALGFGPDNFSVPAFTGAAASHGLFHAWNDPNFQAAVAAIPNVTIVDDVTDPANSVHEACTQVNAAWGAGAPLLAGAVTPGLYQDADGTLWNVIQPYDTAIWPDPWVIPALVRRARKPGVAEVWVQPIDAFDSYQLVVPFTGLPEQCKHNGQTWVTTANTNVWEPGVFGWVVVPDVGPGDGPP